jgi:MFS family permease
MLRAVLPRSRETRRILAGSLFSAIGRGLTLPFLLVYLTSVRGLSAGTVGLLVGWMGLVALGLAPLGGSLIDRLGARRILLPCYAIEFLGTGSLAFVDSTPAAFGALTMAAMGGAALWSGQSTLLASLVPEEERARIFGLSFTLLNLGIGIGGLIAGSVVDTSRPGTFQAVYLGDAISYAIPVVILLSLPHVGRRVTTDLSDAARSDAAAAGAGPADVGAGPRARGGYREVLRNGPFVRFVVFGLTLTTCGYAQIEVGFTAFSIQVAGVTPRVIGWALAGNTFLIVAAQLFVLRWLGGRSRTRALALVGLLFATSWLVLAGAGVARHAAQPALAVAGVVSCSVIFAMGETLLSPVLPVITNALATDELRGRYNAAGSMVWGVSGIVGPIAAGPLIGGGHAIAWLVLVIAGSLAASGLALDLRHRLTPEQDGRDSRDGQGRPDTHEPSGHKPCAGEPYPQEVPAGRSQDETDLTGAAR